MADALPIFESSEDTLQPQSVASSAQGSDALANMFEGLGQETAQVATQINNQQSNANLYAGSALAAQAKNDFLYKLRSNPDPNAADQAFQEYQGAIGGIYQSTPVNASDRVALGRLLNTDYQGGQLQYNKNAVKQSNLTASIAFHTQFPGAMQELGSNLIQNPDAAEANMQMIQENLGTAVRSGVITPTEYANYNTLMQTQMDRSHQLMSMFGNGSAPNAAQYHALTGVPGQTPDMNSPQNQTTAQGFNYLNADFNKQDLTSALYTGQMTPALLTYAATKLPPEDYNEFLLSAGGVNQADALHNSGTGYAATQARIDYLNSQGRANNVVETAELNRLKQIQSGYKYDYLGTISSTPAGQQINQNYLNQVAAIKNTPLQSDAMQQQLESANNERIAQLVNQGRALGVPADQIKPIDNTTAATLQNAFNVNQDTTPILNTAQSLNLTNAAYAANSLKQSNQQQAMYTASLAKSTDKTGFSQTFIVANQNGQNYSQIIFPKGESNKTLTAEIQTAIQPQLEYLSKQPDSANQTSGLLQASVNAVKYQAYQSGDMNLANKKQYIQQVQNYLSEAYDVNKGTNYQFNNTQTPMSPQDAQALANYASNQALDKITNGMSDAQREKAIDNNPLFVTISPDNNVNVIDQHGNIYWQQPFTSSMLGNAKAQHNARIEETKQQLNFAPVYTGGIPTGGF